VKAPGKYVYAGEHFSAVDTLYTVTAESVKAPLRLSTGKRLRYVRGRRSAIFSRVDFANSGN